jgi:Crp-like helix-turn-helix domain
MPLRRSAGCDPVEVPLTQNELAGAANLSRNSVGTMLQRLATRGLVEVGYGTMTVAPLRPCERSSIKARRVGRWSARNTPSAISDGGTGIAMTPYRRRRVLVTTYPDGRRDSGRNRQQKQGIAKRMIKNAIVLKHDRFAATIDRCEPRPEHSSSSAGPIDFFLCEYQKL